VSTITEYRIEYVGDDGELYETHKLDNDFTTGIDGPIYRAYSQDWRRADGGGVEMVGGESLFLDFSDRHPEVKP
jgi:hypothetical protein